MAVPDARRRRLLRGGMPFVVKKPQDYSRDLELKQRANIGVERPLHGPEMLAPCNTAVHRMVLGRFEEAVIDALCATVGNGAAIPELKFAMGVYALDMSTLAICRGEMDKVRAAWSAIRREHAASIAAAARTFGGRRPAKRPRIVSGPISFCGGSPAGGAAPPGAGYDPTAAATPPPPPPPFGATTVLPPATVSGAAAAEATPVAAAAAAGATAPPLPRPVWGTAVRHDRFIGPVEIRAMAGRGRGLVTTRSVECGELLLVSRPVATHEATAPGGFEGLDGMTVPLATAVLERARRSPADLQRIYMLWGGDARADVLAGGMAYGASRLPPVPTIDMFRSDAAAAAAFAGPAAVDEARVRRIVGRNRRHGACNPSDHLHRGAALYLLPSFINHSCVPNAAEVYVGEALVVRASRPLALGEEVTTAYFDVLAPLDERQQNAASWGFSCRCQRCCFERSIGPVNEAFMSHVLCLTAPAWLGITSPDRALAAAAARDEAQGLIIVRAVFAIDKFLSSLCMSEQEARWLRASLFRVYATACRHLLEFSRVDQLAMRLLTCAVDSIIAVCPNGTTHVVWVQQGWRAARRMGGDDSLVAVGWLGNLEAVRRHRYAGLPDEVTVLGARCDEELREVAAQLAQGERSIGRCGGVLSGDGRRIPSPSGDGRRIPSPSGDGRRIPSPSGGGRVPSPNNGLGGLGGGRTVSPSDGFSGTGGLGGGRTVSPSDDGNPSPNPGSGPGLGFKSIAGATGPYIFDTAGSGSDAGGGGGVGGFAGDLSNIELPGSYGGYDIFNSFGGHGGHHAGSGSSGSGSSGIPGGSGSGVYAHGPTLPNAAFGVAGTRELSLTPLGWSGANGGNNSDSSDS